jgi:hypothetical protein
MAALQATASSATAEIATMYRSGSRSQPCSNDDTSPSIGASTHRPPVWGSTEDATSARPA